MSDFIKNNPIALQQCFLYEFLRGKSFETTHSQFCRTVGFIFTRTTRERNFIWFDQFGHGKFDDSRKPMNNIVDILRNDKKALRVCVMYEWLNAENTRSKDPHLKNEALPVFAKYQNFCKVIGDDVMKCREFEFWFYRFANRNFDLNNERDEDQKIYELMDMPLDVMKKIVECLGILDRSSLTKTSRCFQTFVEDQKLFHHELELSIHHNSIDVSISNAVVISYAGNQNECCKRFRNGVQDIHGVPFWKKGILDFKNIIKNPKLHLNTLSIQSTVHEFSHHYRDPLIGVQIRQELYNLLKFAHYLNVEKLSLSFKEPIWNLLLKVLPSLKPGYLTTICIDVTSDKQDEAVMKELVEMEQWKQAKCFIMKSSSFDGSLHYLYHFEKFYVSRKMLFATDRNEMKEILLKSRGFKECTIRVDSTLDMAAIGHEFGDAILGRPYTYHYPIPNSTEYFEIELRFHSIGITRKKI